VHPMRRIEMIKSTLGSGEEGAAEIRAATRVLERSIPVGDVLAAVADPRFPSALIAAARPCAEPEERAWLTLAAAGSERARQVLAWRASQMVDSEELVALAMKRRGARQRGLGQRFTATTDPAAAAWALLAHLRASELKAIVRAHPALAALYRRARTACRPVGALTLRPVLG
jgi:hypothetical protein